MPYIVQPCNVVTDKINFRKRLFISSLVHQFITLILVFCYVSYKYSCVLTSLTDSHMHNARAINWSEHKQTGRHLELPHFHVAVSLDHIWLNGRR